jgi:acyl-CoA reductase-like NAD-dependent aldehyde dehydrogenase
MALKKSDRSPSNRKATPHPTRIQVLKTYKLFIGGAFPRSESERTYPVHGTDGTLIAHASRASRKDLRNAVVAARNGFHSWSGRTAYNRAQILYRIAEMLESRREQFERELSLLGVGNGAATDEVTEAIDRLVHYAGWADKVQQVLSSVNPVSGSFFNFSAVEPIGVLGVIASETPAFLGMIDAILPALTVGNAIVVLPSEQGASICLSFGEVLAASDLPAGVINILAGFESELLPHFASHMEIDGVIFNREGTADSRSLQTIRESGSENLKRLIVERLRTDQGTTDSLERIRKVCEVKTTWHPIAI